jgi:hypothetical protein
VRVAAAYDLAAQLLTGQYRPSGKTFVAHVCGTASIAQLSGGTVDETVAALLHAAYDHGEFRDGRAVVTDRKRVEVRAVVGADAEALIAGYSAWKWAERLRALRGSGADALEDWERPLAFLRLANELEERVDLGSAHSSKQTAYAYPLEDVIECARLLDRGALAELAQAVSMANAGQEVPASLVRHGHGSELLLPRSATRRVGARLMGSHGSVRKIGGHIPGARRVVYAWRRRRGP